MSKLLISCDEFIYEHDGIYYAANQEKYDLFERYLRVFDTIRLVCRCGKEQDLKSNRVPLNQDSRIEIVPVPMFHGIKEYACAYFRVGRSLYNICEGCDAAIIRIPSTLAIRVGYLVIRSGIPYACEVVYDAEDGWRGYKGLSRLAWKRIDQQMRELCSNADGVSCVTEHYLQRHYFSKKNGAFTGHYSSLALDKIFYGQPRLFPKEHVFVIAHLANQIGEQSAKGHKETIEAVKILKERGIEVRVKFAGNNRLGGVERFKHYAEELGVSNEVEFVGFLSREGVGSLLSEADLFVMPTRAEGLPRVIIEAMAKGLPCVTTPVSGNPELIEQHFLVPYEDVENLANRIEELCLSKELYEETSKINFERSKKYEASILQARRDSFYAKLKEKTV